MCSPHPARRLGLAVRERARAVFTLDTRSLALYRMALGAILVADSLLRTRDFALMFGPQGIFPPDVLHRYNAGDVTLWSLALVGDPTWWGGVVLAAEGLAGACLVAGCATRMATIAAWVAVVSILRRTSPATNAGDAWLACQLFWSMFIPLGEAWSWDALRRRGPRPPVTAACSIATAALILQVVAVYLGAGLAKLNDSWISGAALARALSVHDHGTPLGMLIGHTHWLTRPVTWAVLGCDLAAPIVMLLWTGPRIRTAVAATFILFHAAIWLTMSIGLFAAIGMAAWLPLLPGCLWGRREDPVAPLGLGRTASWVCATALAVACAGFLRASGPWPGPAPRPLSAAVNILGLNQEWCMFGDVPPQEQWIYGRAELADGRVVDLLRGGRPLQAERPAGGFSSLEHHRWHKFFWVLPRPHVRVFAAPTAAALAHRWNERHDADEQVQSLELRYAQETVRGADDIRREEVLATWPPRTSAGGSNLDRLLRSATDHVR
jgi:hypothetical protein